MEKKDEVTINFHEKLKGFMVRPVETFKKVRKESMGDVLGYWTALALIFSLLSALVYPVYIATMFSSIRGTEVSEFEKIPVMGDILAGKFSVVVVFAIFLSVLLFSFVALFIAGAWLHLWIRVMGGRRGYKETVKAIAYAQTPSLLFGWIPMAGAIFNLWSLVLEVLGIKELQEMSTEKAAIAVIISIVLLIIIAIFIAFGVIFFIGFSHLPQH